MNKFFQLTRMAFAYKRAQPVLKHPPYMFSIEATNICNYKCSFCPQSDPAHAARRTQGQLSTEGMKCFLDRVVESGTSNRNISICLDGEPTINKHLPQFVRLINDYGFSPRFSSNGRLLDQNLAEALISAGPFLASIDFASQPSYFEQVRGREGDFSRILDQLRYLIDQARLNRNIRLEVVDTSVFSGADPEASLRAMTALLADGQTLPSNVKTWSRQFHNFCGHLDSADGDSYKVCPYPWSQFVVTWDGFAVACCRDTAGRTVLGNVFESPVMQIWNSPQYQQFRRSLAQHRPQDVPACRGCDMPYSGRSSRWRLGYITQSLRRR
ncbi:MAG: radical SAM protein [Actinobacteria bacterium]|nr:radical SAM protein [Actinomycetota bacterium]